MLMPGALTQVIQGAAHAPQLSHPAETATAIASFLASLETAPAATEVSTHV